MNTNELTKYIKNYLENAKTRSAIMLTGAWGCGKSYYIQNELVPALTDEEENRCVVVSLYGIKSLEALSKSIYLEVRAKALIKKSESISRAKIIGKTIVKGVASFFGVDINVSEESLNQLYQSIDLTGKLIILEDLERSGLGILEVMGYVNNLVEQDGVKVLLVANEGEIIKYKTKEETVKGVKKEIKKIPTTKTEKYLRIKEKTVSDTIPFYANLESSIENILKSFSSEYFAKAVKIKSITGIPLIVEEIVKIMFEVKCNNLRALLYSCQKTMEMFTKAKKEYNIQYFQFVLCSNTAFALKLSKNSNLVWTDNIKSPTELSSYHFPLYQCCYDYIKMQFFDNKQFEQNETAYIKQKSFEVKQKDLQKALNILYGFYEKMEEEVFEAIKKISTYLKEKEDYFPLEQYSKLANYLIAAKKYIDDEQLIDQCKQSILKKVQKSVLGDDIIHKLTYHDGIELWTDEQKKEYNEFKEQMLTRTKVESVVVLEQIKSVDDIQKLSENIYKNRDKYIGNRKFASELDIAGLLRVLPECHPSLIERLRGSIMEIYRSVNIGDFLMEDKPALILLKDGIDDLLRGNRINDKIKKLQLEWFFKNLEDIISGLN